MKDMRKIISREDTEKGQLPVVFSSLLNLTPFPVTMTLRGDKTGHIIECHLFDEHFPLLSEGKEESFAGRSIILCTHSFRNWLSCQQERKRERKSTKRQDVGLFTHTLCLHHPVSCDPTVGLLSNCLPSSSSAFLYLDRKMFICWQPMTREVR